MERKISRNPWSFGFPLTAGEKNTKGAGEKRKGKESQFFLRILKVCTIYYTALKIIIHYIPNPNSYIMSYFENWTGLLGHTVSEVLLFISFSM